MAPKAVVSQPLPKRDDLDPRPGCDPADPELGDRPIAELIVNERQCRYANEAYIDYLLGLFPE